MTPEERELLREYGERLARIETTLENHVMHEFASLKSAVAELDSRLWWILGTALVTLGGIIATLLR